MKSHTKSGQQQARKSNFFEGLEYVEQTLNERGIEHRVIGSIGASALLGQDLNFKRPGAIAEHQKVPDIDIIVPRDDLDEMRAIREEVLELHGIKIGLANATGEIDFRPGEDVSYLTHKDVRMPVGNELLRPEVGEVNGVSVTTLPIETLLQTYGTFGGIVREKDMKNIRKLLDGSDPDGRDRMQVFYDFRRYRRSESPNEARLGRALEKLEKYPLVKNAIGLAAIKAADLLGRR